MGLRPFPLFLLVSSLLVAARAEAIPAFSRRTGMACPACHQPWPRLNDVGELYRDRGYRMGTMSDADWKGTLELVESVPVSLRTAVGYRYSVATHQATDSGVESVGSGAFAFPEADIYFAAALANHVSVFVDVAGFGKEGTASLESAWVRFNDVGTNWLNLKIGILELDLPVSMHRSLGVFTPFLIYGFHPTASINGFNPGDNQLAVELMGHANGPGLRYSISLASSGDVASAAVLSAPTVYAHVTYTKLFDSRVVPRLRVGLKVC